MNQLPLSAVTYHILLALADGQRHGYGILKEVQALSGGAIELETGTLYAAIRRLRSDRLIEAAAAIPGQDTRRKNYRLTAAGASLLRAETRRLGALLRVAETKRVLPATG